MTKKSGWVPHRHWQVTVKRDGWVLRWLQKPLWHTRTVVPAIRNEWDQNRWDRIDASPYPYGPCTGRGHDTAHVECWYLSALSILHRWTGFSVWVQREPEED